MESSLNSKLAQGFLAAVFAGLIALAVCAPVRASGCQQFFHHKQAVAYVAPVAAVIYQAGANLEIEAQVEKAVGRALLKYQQQLNVQPQHQPQQVTQQQTPQRPSAFAKCVRCHTGPNAAAGVQLDGSRVVCHTYARWGEMAGLGRNIPKEMQALIASMTPQEKGAVADDMLNLGAAELPVVQPAKQEPEFVPPAPDGGLR
jgi:hypothetical protein